MIYIFNYNSYRQEGGLRVDLTDKNPEAVKICKFMQGTDILVSADLEGYIHFWCVTATPHPKKNQLLCSVRDFSESDVGEKAFFPIRAMDFDIETGMLYTGDEMGYMNKWDISKLIEKLDDMKPKDFNDGLTEKQREVKQKAAFLTGLNENLKVQFSSDDVIQVHRWKAHQDLINSVTYVPELQVVATCSFDCNVYMWDKMSCVQVGSLVLGTGTSANSEQSEHEKRKYAKIW